MPRRVRRAAFVAVFVVLAADSFGCGGTVSASGGDSPEVAGSSEDAATVSQAPGTARVTGTIGGETVPTASVDAVTSDVRAEGLGEYAVVAISNYAYSCDQIAGAGEHKSSTMLSISCHFTGDSLLATGTYPVGVKDGVGTQISYVTTDSRCGLKSSQDATSGTVTFTKVGAAYVGTLDAVFGADHVTASFTSLPACFPPRDGGASTTAASDGGTCL
jgi:hypothetical protein